MALLTPSGAPASPGSSRWFRTALVLLAVFCTLFSLPRPVVAQSSEYKIKAVFLFNFLQFAEWPEDAFLTPTSPIEIGVLGADPFGAALDLAVRGETIDGRGLVVKRSSRIEDLQDCHLLFISASEARRLDSVLAQLARHPLITVGDSENFARRGGIIGFYTDGRKVRFEINVAAARRKGVKLSSELLRLGRIIDGPPPPKEGS